tara:strand:- start:819 stop:1136 length:318 start_codon:yes stop_codon:yes gene_type:complete
MDKLLKLTSWFAESFSGSDKVSGRRLTAFAVTAMYLFSRGYYVTNTAALDVEWQFYGFVVDAAFVLLLFGIVTMQQITALKNGTKLEKTETKTEFNSETKTETTQ